MSNSKAYCAKFFLQKTIFINIEKYQKFIYDLFFGMYTETYRTFNEYKQLLSDVSILCCDIY